MCLINLNMQVIRVGLSRWLRARINRDEAIKSTYLASLPGREKMGLYELPSSKHIKKYIFRLYFGG